MVCYVFLSSKLEVNQYLQRVLPELKRRVSKPKPFKFQYFAANFVVISHLSNIEDTSKVTPKMSMATN